MLHMPRILAVARQRQAKQAPATVKTHTRLSFTESVELRRPTQAAEELMEVFRKHAIPYDEYQDALMRLVEIVGAAKGMAQALDGRYGK